MMANTLDSISIRGLRHTHFAQLLELLLENKENGEYYGNKEQYWKRHDELEIWVKNIYLQSLEPNNKIPAKVKI